jgi:hypothetical protein
LSSAMTTGVGLDPSSLLLVYQLLAHLYRRAEIVFFWIFSFKLLKSKLL